MVLYVIVVLHVLAFFVSVSDLVISITAWFIIIYAIMWGILIIMSVNRSAFYLIIQSFEFWFKIYYALILCIT